MFGPISLGRSANPVSEKVMSEQSFLNAFGEILIAPFNELEVASAFLVTAYGKKITCFKSA
jgi:hypothetical protein